MTGSWWWLSHHGCRWWTVAVAVARCGNSGRVVLVAVVVIVVVASRLWLWLWVVMVAVWWSRMVTAVVVVVVARCGEVAVVVGQGKGDELEVRTYM